MAPEFSFIIPCKNSNVICIGASELIIIDLVIFSWVCSWKYFPTTIPALLIRISTFPTSVLTLCAAFLISSRIETSTLYVEISFPNFANSSLVLAKPSSLMSQIIKLEAPLSKDFLAMILPIPEQPPVISTFLLLKSISINFSFIQQGKILQKSIRFL